MSNEFNKRLLAFDRQCNGEYWSYVGKMKYKKLKYDSFDKWKLTNSTYLEKKVFIEKQGLSILDWKLIRSGDYWSIFDGMKGKSINDSVANANRAKFTLNRIKDYKLNLKNHRLL